MSVCLCACGSECMSDIQRDRGCEWEGGKKTTLFLEKISVWEIESVLLVDACVCACVCVRVCGCGCMGEQACVWKGCLSLFRSYLFELPYLFDQMAGKVAASGRVLKTNLVRDDILKIMDGCWKMSFGSVARWHCCCCCCCCWHKKTSNTLPGKWKECTNTLKC